MTAHLGLGLAAVGRPAYVNLGREEPSATNGRLSRCTR